jgi:hypothetical protein
MKGLSMAKSNAPAVIGKMTIEFIDNGTSLPVPRVTFDPIGRITPGCFHHYQTYFVQEIQRAGVAVRTGRTAARVTGDGNPGLNPEGVG